MTLSSAPRTGPSRRQRSVNALSGHRPMVAGPKVKTKGHRVGLQGTAAGRADRPEEDPFVCSRFALGEGVSSARRPCAPPDPATTPLASGPFIPLTGETRKAHRSGTPPLRVTQRSTAEPGPEGQHPRRAVCPHALLNAGSATQALYLTPGLGVRPTAAHDSPQGPGSWGTFTHLVCGDQSASPWARLWVCGSVILHKPKVCDASCTCISTVKQKCRPAPWVSRNSAGDRHVLSSVILSVRSPAPEVSQVQP